MSYTQTFQAVVRPAFSSLPYWPLLSNMSFSYQILIKPADHFPQVVRWIFGSRKCCPVPSSGYRQQFGFYAHFSKYLFHYFGVFERHNFIGIAVNKEKRRVVFGYVIDGKGFFISFIFDRSGIISHNHSHKISQGC